MSCARNITTAFFNGGRTATTAPLYQWDYGQILSINGLTLPAAFQVHFSNTPRSGTTTTSIGQDGQVTIPDVYLTKGLPVYAFIFLHNSEDDGETEYVITIPVNARPRPTDEEPTPSQHRRRQEVQRRQAGAQQRRHSPQPKRRGVLLMPHSLRQKRKPLLTGLNRRQGSRVICFSTLTNGGI